MFVTTSQIPAAWFLGVAIGWTAIAFYLCYKGNWFDVPDRHGSFPFTARQFFLIGLSLVCAYGLYLASFLLARNIVEALKQLPVSASCAALSGEQWFGLEQFIGLLLATLGLSFFTSLIPDDLEALVIGSSGNWRKLARGVAAGVIIYPIVIASSWIVGCLVDVFTQEPKAPQIAIEILKSLSASRGWLVLTVITMITVVPFVEEMLFRGYLQGFLQGILHPVLATICTACAFAALHYAPIQKGANYEILVGLFVFSIFSSRIRLKEESIYSSIGLHASFNATSIALYFAQQ
jgi:membrane protease YdiL (CAAX protease family)